MPSPILIIDDDPLQRQMLSTLIRRKLGITPQEADNGQSALYHVDHDPGHTIKLVVLDLNMPGMSGMEVLDILHQKHPSIGTLILTGNNDVQDAVEAMKRGAIDFITKPYEPERMAITIKNAFRISTLTKEVNRLKGEKEGTFTFADLTGHDAGLSHIVSVARKAASANIPVLVAGETGTGKEVLAKAIHGESNRRGHPFIAVNCGAIPEQLVESTLFGHEKGSFTGATQKTLGKFREADGGTIFLDEVGELPLEAQVKLLRVLQQKEVEPVGAGRPVRVNVRIISATNRDLKAEVDAGRFREDLFFRLNVLPITMPPLRQRKEDIPRLIHHFIDRFAAQNDSLPMEISEKDMKKLQHLEWPGNVRQLENAINRAIVMSDGYMLDIETITGMATSAVLNDAISGTDRDDAPDVGFSEPDAMAIALLDQNGTVKTAADIKSEAIQKVLEYCGNNVTKASKALGMAKSTFYKKISK